MTTATPRTLAFNIALTQNTAPVHEYRCMFSHDVRKKKKKWHDGSVRFHTFNKRVMVYDETKNFIGDLHYRDGDEFGEGTEIQLDRGVLVQVEDRIGQTETDLTPLLERRHAGDESQTPRPVIRSSIARAYENPKSLAALLGPSQGRLGRARLPQRSPFEQRQVHVAPEPIQQPSKRRRLSYDKENDIATKEVVERPIPRVREAPLRRQSKGGGRNAEQEMKTPQATDIVDLSREDDTATRRPERPESSRLPDSRHTEQTMSSNDPRGNDTTPTVQRSKRKQNTNAQSANSKSNSNRTSSKIQKPRNVIPPKPPTRPRALLQFSAAPTRRKLLSRQLLADSSKTAEEHISEQICAPVFDIDDVLEAGDIEAAPIHIPDPSQAEPSQYHSFPASMLASLQCTDPFAADNDTSEASIHDLRSPEPRNCSQETFPDVESSSESAFETLPISPLRDRSIMEEIVAVQDSPKATLAPPQPVADTTPATRAFRRVVSEHDGFTAFQELSVDRPTIPSALESLNPVQSRRTLRSAFKAPSRPIRALSDMDTPVGAAPLRIEPDTGTVSKSGKDESGPWTEMEAYVLFDWWPPNRQKPSYNAR